MLIPDAEDKDSGGVLFLQNNRKRNLLPFDSNIRV